MDKQELYADGFGNITVTGSIVRIDLVALVEPGSQDIQPKFQLRQRVVMPLDAFVRSFGMAEDVMKKLISTGVVAVRPPQEAAPESATVTAEVKVPADTKETKDAKSPNFH